MELKAVLHHFFFPHAGNNHRAKALHLDTMVVYLLLFALFNVGIKFVGTTAPGVLGYATNIHVQELLNGTNQKRIESGLPPLVLNAELSQAAAAKAADMFGNNYWAHVSPGGKTPWNFILGSGYKYSVAGENLAKNFQDSPGVVDAWMASPTHKDNLLKSSYKEVGFAVVNGKLLGEETTLVVQMFGSRPAAAPVTQVSAPDAGGSTLPRPAPVIAAEPLPTSAVSLVPSPVVVSEVASVTEDRVDVPMASVLSLPKVDIVTLRRDVTLLFAGMIMGVLFIDLYLAAKRHKVRAVGSTVAHVLFFLAILASTNMIFRGSIL